MMKRAPNNQCLGLTKKNNQCGNNVTHSDKLTCHRHPEYEDKLQKLASHYGVEIDAFFDESLCVERMETIPRFTALLATGNHNYLADLVNDVFKRSWRETVDLDDWISSLNPEAVLLTFKQIERPCESYPIAIEKIQKAFAKASFSYSEFVELKGLFELAESELRTKTVKKSTGLHGRIKNKKEE